MIRDLFIRCKNYTELAGKFATRSISIQRFDGDATYNERKNKVRMLDTSDVHRIARECGWDDDWPVGKKPANRSQGDEPQQSKAPKLSDPPKKDEAKAAALASTQGFPATAPLPEPLPLPAANSQAQTPQPILPPPPQQPQQTQQPSAEEFELHRPILGAYVISHWAPIGSL